MYIAFLEEFHPTEMPMPHASGGMEGTVEKVKCCYKKEHVEKFDKPPVHDGKSFQPYALFNEIRELGGVTKVRFCFVSLLLSFGHGPPPFSLLACYKVLNLKGCSISLLFCFFFVVVVGLLDEFLGDCYERLV
jgi:hypothetical protein